MLQVRVAPAGRRWVGGGAQLLLPLLLCGVIAVEPAPLQSHRCCHHLWDEFSSTLRAGRLWEKRGLQRPLYPRRFSALSKSPSLQKPPLTQNLHHTPSFCTHTHTQAPSKFGRLPSSFAAPLRISGDRLTGARAPLHMAGSQQKPVAHHCAHNLPPATKPTRHPPCSVVTPPTSWTPSWPPASGGPQPRATPATAASCSPGAPMTRSPCP